MPDPSKALRDKLKSLSPAELSPRGPLPKLGRARANADRKGRRFGSISVAGPLPATACAAVCSPRK